MAPLNVVQERNRLADRLGRETQGEVLFSRADRGRYSTDASIYQVQPVGVFVPRTSEDVVTAMAIAREAGVPVLPRGGGTSQCGQTVNRALVVDCSKHLRSVLDVDPEAKTARVEPGIVLGHLNARSRSTVYSSPLIRPRIRAARSAEWPPTIRAAANRSATA